MSIQNIGLPAIYDADVSSLPIRPTLNVATRVRLTLIESITRKSQMQ